MLTLSQYANELCCKYCGETNSATQWPVHGDMVPFYYQTERGKYHVRIHCPHCAKDWYVVWDDNPGAGCETGTRPIVPSMQLNQSNAEPQLIRWNCLACGKSLKTTSENRGKNGKCRYCGKEQVVPKNSPQATPSSSTTASVTAARVKAKLRFTLTHNEQPSAVDISADGKVLAVGTYSHLVCLWNLSNGTTLKSLGVSWSITKSLKISPNGRTLAVIGSRMPDCRGAGGLWSLPDGKQLSFFEQSGEYGFSCVAFSPNSRYLVCGGDGGLWLWSVPEGRMLKQLKTENDICISFSPDGKLLAAAGDNSVELITLSDFRVKKKLAGHTKSVRCLAISADGRLLASGGWDDTIRLWTLADGRAVKTLTGRRGSADALGITPDMKLLVSGCSDNAMQIWSIPNGNLLQTIDCHYGVGQVALRSDGKLLISRSGNLIELRRLPEGKLLETIEKDLDCSLECMALAPDGRNLANRAGEKPLIYGI